MICKKGKIRAGVSEESGVCVSWDWWASQYFKYSGYGKPHWESGVWAKIMFLIRGVYTG